MFANDENRKNIKTYAGLLQDIREGKESKNPVHVAASEHTDAINDINQRYENDPYKTYDASHLKDKSRHEVDQLNRSHTKLVDIHHAHATFHYIAGNQEAAEAHEKAAKQHKHCADVSDWDYGMPTSHEEFDHASSNASYRGADALTKHPLTSKMFKKR